MIKVRHKVYSDIFLTASAINSLLVCGLLYSTAGTYISNNKTTFKFFLSINCLIHIFAAKDYFKCIQYSVRFWMFKFQSPSGQHSNIIVVTLNIDFDTFQMFMSC